MLRPLTAAIAATLLLAACGDSSSPAPSAPTPLAGTAFGQPFTPVDATALILSEAVCTIGSTTGSGTGLAVGFSTVPGLCAFATANGVCAEQPTSTTVDLLVVHANLAGGTAGAVQPGTYTIGALPLDLSNVIVARAVETKAGCATTATSGTIRIATVSPRVTGSADVTFPDGHVAGSFDAETCTTATTDACTAASCTLPACAP